MNRFKEVFPLKKGYKISGRWEGSCYKVIKHLGEGGNGSVYLAEDETGALKALKISPDVFGLTSEYRVLVFLRSCKELHRHKIVPQVYEIDDFQVGTSVYHFIAMEYCAGMNLRRLKGRLNEKHTAIVGQQVAEFLSDLHKLGFIFGDLKPANIIFDFHTQAVRVIDYGSVTIKGAEIKQFTPGYDRASWQTGTRTADEKYDAFSLGILLETLLFGKITPCEKNGISNAISNAKQGVHNPNLQRVIISALSQEISCEQIAHYLTSAVQDLENTGNHGADNLANIVGLASAASFLLSLFYFYRFN